MLPDLPQALERFEVTYGYRLEPDVPFGELEFDSVDLMEWLLDLEEESAVVFDEDDLLDALDGAHTIREFYAALATTTIARPGSGLR